MFLRKLLHIYVKYLAFVTQMYIFVTHLTTIVLHMATITARVDDKLKAQLIKATDELGISVSALFSLWAKSLIRTRKITLELDDDFGVDYVEVNEPAEKVLAQMKKVIWKNG